MDGQQPSSVGAELGLPAPLEERQLDALSNEPAYSQSHVADDADNVCEVLRHGVVQGVAALELAQLVAQYEHELVLVEVLQQPRGDHHERISVPVSVGVGEGVVLDEEVRRLHLKHLTGLDVMPVYAVYLGH